MLWRRIEERLIGEDVDVRDITRQAPASICANPSSAS
jgi:hypothetical protein